MVLSDRSGVDLDFWNDCWGNFGCHRIIGLDIFGSYLQHSFNLPHVVSHCQTIARFRQGMDMDFHRVNPIHWSDLDDYLALSTQRNSIELD